MKRLTTKTRDRNCALFKDRTSQPYKSSGMHINFIKWSAIPGDEIRPTFQICCWLRARNHV